MRKMDKNKIKGETRQVPINKNNNRRGGSGTEYRLICRSSPISVQENLPNTTTREKTSKKKSVSWWRDNLTLMRKKVNACRKLFQRTRRENRKKKYLEAKRRYQDGIKKEKLNSWKEFCNVATSINPWSQVYKLWAGKTRANSIMTTLRK